MLPVETYHDWKAKDHEQGSVQAVLEKKEKELDKFADRSLYRGPLKSVSESACILLGNVGFWRWGNEIFSLVCNGNPSR
jgi:hypothetical protein